MRLFTSILKLIFEIPLAVFGTFIFQQSWNWFIFGTIDSVPHLSFLGAFGIVLVLAFVKTLITPNETILPLINEEKNKKDEKEELVQTITLIIARLFVYFIALGVFWLYHTFIWN